MVAANICDFFGNGAPDLMKEITFIQLILLYNFISPGKFPDHIASMEQEKNQRDDAYRF